MTCDYLEKYDRGVMDEAEFRIHAAHCSSCQGILKLDEDVLSMAKSFRQPIEVPNLWNRIEKSLAAEITEENRIVEESRDGKGLWRWLKFAPAIAALVLILWLGSLVILKTRTPSSGLMAKNTLARVEKKEQEYIEAIRDLEKQALPKMADMDLQLVFLYRDRLDTINAQIEQCKEALAFNPANAHIRRYLMTALHDKKETLIEILNPGNEKVKSRRSI